MPSEINPDLGLELLPERTLEHRLATVDVVIPAHNERATIAEVIGECRRGLRALAVEGDVIVAASACTDDTAEVAEAAGAMVVETPIGKGAALKAGVSATEREIICLIDGDIQYFGSPPLVTLLVGPILHGTADVTISDLYWRPLYPQLWLHGFFAPIAGRLYPELLPKVGSTPWSGQRAAVRSLWPKELPEDFTVDLELLMHWNRHALRMRPVIADDWTNPQRPKPDLMATEFSLLVRHALKDDRLTPDLVPFVERWFTRVHDLMAGYAPGTHDPQAFERELLEGSLSELRGVMTNVRRVTTGDPAWEAT